LINNLNYVFIYFSKIEVNSRLDFLWREQFKKEIEQVEITSTMSRLLLENMLPKHVVGIIMNPNRKKDVNNLFLSKYVYLLNN
jgi:hypothetical protein